ncbi:MAG TPA: hypothetical protein VGM90_30545 [Kofleriaceae bacterium]
MRSLVIAIGLAGCWTGPAEHSTLEPVPANEAPRLKATPPLEGPFPAHTIWRGRYTCSQGDTAMQLTLDLAKGGRVIAIFDFGPLDSNPTVPAGSYRLIGHLDDRPEGLALKLYPDRWISQPDGYEMVELSAKSDRRRRHMRGTIDHYGCGALSLDLVE